MNMLSFLLFASTAFGFVATEDFALVDDRGGSYGIDIDIHSALTHRHGFVENGRYRIPVEGNRHFLAAPALRDFRLELYYELVPFRRHDLSLGYTVFFRHDRATDRGHRLDILYDRDYNLRFTLDGRDLLVRPDGKFPKLDGLNLVLDVKGGRGHAETLGASVDFDLPQDDAAGEIGFDLTTNESIKLILDGYRLTSPEEPALTPVGRWHFALDGRQGFPVPPVFDVAADRYPDGKVRLVCRLSGTILSCPKRAESGGGEWEAMTERLEDPYVRVEWGENKAKSIVEVEERTGNSKTFYLWNGRRQYSDPNKAGPPDFPWPLERTFIVRDFPSDFTLAAGYGCAASVIFRFLSDGPHEQVQTKDGKVVFEGPALEAGRIALSVRSPSDKAIVRRIAADLPERERALRHAREGHYFLASETPRFTFETTWRAADFADGEIELAPRLENVYGESTDVDLIPADDEMTVDLGAGLRRRTCSYRLSKNPGVGVWHLETAIQAGAPSVSRIERTVFEVLSDTPGGKAPPLVSGLPEFVSMPNETKYLEESAFDPLAEGGGLRHYYSIDMRYPKVGERLRIWELDHVYDRKYFTWSWSRNTDDWDMTHDCNRTYMRHADYFGGYPNGKNFMGQVDLALPKIYHDFQLQVLSDWIAARGHRMKLLTPETLAARAKAKKGLTPEEVREVFETGWDDFKAYANERSQAWIQAFVDDLLSVNPKLARASYGPYNVYTSCYKSPYTFEMTSHPIERDPRIRANGSFWLLEDYHYSCDYPLCRPAYLAAGYGLYCPYGRRLFPEIYYQGWSRCEDGAVYQAHPDLAPPLAFTHQRRIVYQYVYGTGFLRDDGTYGFWRDDGFHARNPEREAMDDFVRAWGKVRNNRPARPLKAPYVFVDSDAFRRFGDTFVPGGAWTISVPGFEEIRPDVVNFAEESVGYAYEQCCAAGYATPVVARLKVLDKLTKENCAFAILPPLVKGTPSDVIAAVRRAHERGVNLLGMVAVAGLEDIFETSTATDFAIRETKWGRTVFVRRAPTTIGRSTFLTRYQRGREGLDPEIARGMRAAFAALADTGCNRAERGTMMATETEKGDYVVVLSDDSPIYGDTAKYPVSFRFVVTAPGVGKRKIEADAPYSVVSRSPDRLELRTETDKDSAQFFRFGKE